jgi:hypothetical protein
MIFATMRSQIGNGYADIYHAMHGVTLAKTKEICYDVPAIAGLTMHFSTNLCNNLLLIGMQPNAEPILYMIPIATQSCLHISENTNKKLTCKTP